MKFHFLSVVVALLCAATRAGDNERKPKSNKVCNHVSCCTANEEASLNPSFLLEFTTGLPTPICANLQEKLEHDFVISYNYMANLNCDAPCFRRARAARIVAAPANAFAACSNTHKEGGDHEYPLQRQRQVMETMSGDNAMVIELELEQAGECTTALDGQVGQGDAAHPDEYKKACGRPAWAFDYSWHKDICHYEEGHDYYAESDVCCCACHADRSLSEEDLTAKHAKSHTLSKLGAELFSVRELYERDVCYEETVELTSSFLFIFSTENVEMSDTTHLFDMVAGSYNALSFENCDELGRQLTGGTTDTNPVRRRKLQGGGRANRYPAGACRGGGCVGSDASGQAQCPPNQCGTTSGSSFFDFGNRRRNLEHHGKVDVERLLAMTPISTTASESIVDQCLCPVHQPGATGTAPEFNAFVDRFNRAIDGHEEFANLGELEDVIEFKAFPSAGPPNDFYLWLPVYIKGNPCAFDYTEQEKLAELILESYNDIVVEDCDKPLFRQILTAWTWQDPNLNCYMQEHVVHVKIEARCHGYCSHKNPLFSPYKKHDEYRRLRKDVEDKDETAPYNPEDLHVDFSQNAKTDKDMPPLSSVHQSARQMGEYGDDYVHEPGPDGICLVQGGEAGMSTHPTVAGLEERVNSAYPTAAVSFISILTEPLCRCEGPREYLYYYGYGGNGSQKHYPDSLDEYYTMNGIYIVPKKNHPCSYHRNLREDRDLQGGYVFPCYSY